jgi:hypothetical protein
MIAIPMNEQAVTVLMENGPGNMDVKAFIMQKDNDYPPRIVVAYQQFNGDREETDAGIEGPAEGHEMLPDLVAGVSSVQYATIFLRQAGAREPSSSFFHPGLWYEQLDDHYNYRTNETTRMSFHLKGFTPEQEKEIHSALTRKK